MERRQFANLIPGGLFLLVGTTRLPKAQGATTVRRIGWLSGGRPLTPDSLRDVSEALRERGWIEGQNLLIERRYAEGRAELLTPLADELVRLSLEIIITNGTDAALAAKHATTNIPIVMFSAGDPVRMGLVQSLARPGGNITGYSILTPELDAKLLSLLRELLPAAQRVGVLLNPANPISTLLRKESELIFRSLGMQPIFIEVVSSAHMQDAVAEVARRGGHAMLVGAESVFISNRVAIMRAALRHALPTFVGADIMLEAGALVSYSINWPEQCQRHAVFVDKILRGAKPADLPIEQPTKFDLAINLRTAVALGLTIPQSLLARAETVIR